LSLAGAASQRQEASGRLRGAAAAVQVSGAAAAAAGGVEPGQA
jgi:hypothetical protein